MSPEDDLRVPGSGGSDESARGMSAPVTLCEWIRPVGVGCLEGLSEEDVPIATPNMSGIDFVRLRNLRVVLVSGVGAILGGTGLDLLCVRMLWTLIRDLFLNERPCGWDMSMEVETF